MTPIESERKFVAVTCSHGPHLSDPVRSELRVFLADFKPDLRIHLGDVWDTTAWRSGAGGTADESSDIDADFDAGCNLLREYEPHLVFLGNHDARPYSHLRDPSAIMRKAAADCVKEMEALIRDELRAELVPYNIASGWRVVGDTAFGHGFMYGENAVRDHCEMLGMNVVMGHVHTMQSQPARCVGGHTGYSAGLLADIPSLEYAQRRRATLKWRNGWIYGYYTATRTEIHEHRSPRVERTIARALAAGAIG